MDLARWCCRHFRFMYDLSSADVCVNVMELDFIAIIVGTSQYSGHGSERRAGRFRRLSHVALTIQHITRRGGARPLEWRQNRDSARFLRSPRTSRETPVASGRRPELKLRRSQSRSSCNDRSRLIGPIRRPNSRMFSSYLNTTPTVYQACGVVLLAPHFYTPFELIAGSHMMQNNARTGAMDVMRTVVIEEKSRDCCMKMTSYRNCSKRRRYTMPRLTIASLPRILFRL